MTPSHSSSFEAGFLTFAVKKIVLTVISFKLIANTFIRFIIVGQIWRLQNLLYKRNLRNNSIFTNLMLMDYYPGLRKVFFKCLFFLAVTSSCRLPLFRNRPEVAIAHY